MKRNSLPLSKDKGSLKNSWERQSPSRDAFPSAASPWKRLGGHPFQSHRWIACICAPRVGQAPSPGAQSLVQAVTQQFPYTRAEYIGTISSLLLLAALFLIQARMPLAFLFTWAHFWLLFSWLSTNSLRFVSSHSAPSLQHCKGLLQPKCKTWHWVLLNFILLATAHNPTCPDLPVGPSYPQADRHFPLSLVLSANSLRVHSLPSSKVSPYYSENFSINIKLIIYVSNHR